MRVLGVDPGLRMGLAAVDLAERRVLAWTCASPQPNPALGLKTLQMAERARDLRDAFQRFHAAWGGAVAVEAQVGATFAKGGPVEGSDGGAAGDEGRSSPSNIWKLGVAYGVVLGAAPSPPLLLTPGDIRRRLLGGAQASKTAVFAACRERLDPAAERPPPPKGGKRAQEAAWDAVAVALAARPEVERAAALAPAPRGVA